MRLATGSVFIGFVIFELLGSIAGCCFQSTGASGRRTSSGGSPPTGGTGCTIDGQFYSRRAENPANAAECCNPDLSDTNWQPLFTRVFNFPFPPGNVAFSATIADLNHDGSDDVAAVVNLYDGGVPHPVPGIPPVWIFLSSDGGFDAQVLIGNPQEVGGDLTVGDLNRDGQNDIVFATG